MEGRANTGESTHSAEYVVVPHGAYVEERQLADRLAEALQGLYSYCPDAFAYAPADAALDAWKAARIDGLDDAGKLDS